MTLTAHTQSTPGSDEAVDAQARLLAELQDVHVQALTGAGGVAQLMGDANQAAEYFTQVTRSPVTALPSV